MHYNHQINNKSEVKDINHKTIPDRLQFNHFQTKLYPNGVNLDISSKIIPERCYLQDKSDIPFFHQAFIIIFHFIT